MIVHKVNLDGSLSHKEYLNSVDELNTWLAEKYGKFVTVRIESEKTGKVIKMTDNGFDWEVLKENKPEEGKQYLLIGGKGQKSIANGNTWMECEINDAS
tara:strand:- start:1754 stop:2050 length:297 start_codon:yes stop_codon:yes gene_type:complete